MANNKEKAKGARTSIEEINDSLTSLESKLENNKKIIYWAIGIIVVIAIVVLGYIYGIRNPNIEKAKAEIAKADTDLALGNEPQALKEYQAVADGYSNEFSNRAALEAAEILYKDKKYNDAIKYLESYEPDGVLVGPASQSLLGDCYVNVKNYDKALSAFDKAISLSKDNVLYTPVFMMKKATIYREQKNYKAEADVYQKMKDKFPQFGQAYQIDIDKYLERANAQAGK
ncbi:MAG: tetratricopeptide repeat protein [Muribaculaceae bacterium]|jgi:tetratricopeptide (TPR) repeat protein|nr:tetratricopeptide repeat protein [Muribaculaceae bacterium]